jgi:hypothetical protein
MKKITCKGCGWKWDLSDGGKEPYLCHKCGNDNTNNYITKIHINEEDLQYVKDSIINGEVLTEDLGRWFKEKWVDVSRKIDGKHPPCGRKSADGEKGRKGYPKCRPKKKVSKDTPKTASSYSKKEKKSMTTQKRRAEKKEPKTGKGNKPTLTKFNENMEKRRIIQITEEQLKNIVSEMIDGRNDEISQEDLNSLKRINDLINRNEVIQFFNDNDIEYNNMTDIEMYIKYIEMGEYDDLGSTEETDYIADDLLNEAEYKGRKVKLGKIMQGDVKKFKVYVKNDKGNVVKVNFGFGGKSAKGKRMTIKKNDPERRKSFRARHNCDNPGPRWKPRFWVCRTW